MQGLAIVTAILGIALIVLIFTFFAYVVPKIREEERGKLISILNHTDKVEINADSKVFWDRIDKYILKIAANSKNTNQARTLQELAEKQKQQTEELNQRLQKENDNLLEAVTTLSAWQKDFRSISYHSEQLMHYLGPYAKHFNEITHAQDIDK